MTMTTAKKGEVKLRLAGTGTAVINWGDGTPDKTVTLSTHEDDSDVISHTYSISTPRTITITGDNIAELSCGNNQLTALDVSRNTTLTSLNCWGNQITSLDVSGNKLLERLYCFQNQLTNLDVSENKSLESFSCCFNQITALDVSQNLELICLDCEKNQLTSLDASQNKTLWYLNCSSNQLSAVALNTLFASLHANQVIRDDNGEILDKRCKIKGNSGAAECDQSIATTKEWEIDDEF